MISVQKATDQDLESIWALDYLVLGNPSRKAFLVNAVTAGQCLAARIGGTVVGFGVLEHSFYSHGFISLLIVHPDHRRHGVAKALISHIESISPTQKLFTSTNKSNVIARRLFESLGYVRSGYIENLDEDDPEIIYFKRLEKPDTALTRK